MRGAAFLVAVVFAAMPARADDLADLMTTVEQYSSAYNAADLNAWVGLCTSKTVIMDSVAPFVFQGPSACSNWWQAQTAASLKNGWTNTKFVPGKPLDFQVQDGKAYLTVMSQFSYTRDGKSEAFPGLWTLTFAQTKAGWRVIGWTWSG